MHRIISDLDIAPYIPISAVNFISDLINTTGVDLLVKNSRKSKLGDYRPPIGSFGHRITINKDLNKYQFLITLLHEFAHLKNWNKYGRRVKSHGVEWKDEFKELINSIEDQKCFPSDIQDALEKHLSNLKSSCSLDLGLQRVFKKYDSPSDKIFVADLSKGMRFAIDNGREFLVLKKLQKRFKCMEIGTNRKYLFNPTQTVTLR